jgi:UDP-glucose 4-epimerase
MGRRVLITGVSRFLGSHLARALEADPSVEAIFGVDLTPPALELERTEFIRADIRNPLIVRVLTSTEVDTVVHAAVIATPAGAGGRASMKEINIIGTMQLFAACQKAPALRHVVMKSTTAIYGSDPTDPAIFTEAMGPSSEPKTGYARDAWEVENAARAFDRRRPDVDLTLLRFANFIGPQIDTPLTRYLSLPVVPTALGFDPRIQFLHEDDAVEILRRAVVAPVPGTFNVAGDGIVYLSQAIRMCGKVPLPVPSAAIGPIGSLVRRTGLVDFSSEQLAFLLYGRVADVHAMKTVFGFTPRYTTRQALRDHAARSRLARVFTDERAAEMERKVVSMLGRRRDAGGTA